MAKTINKTNLEVAYQAARLALGFVMNLHASLRPILALNGAINLAIPPTMPHQVDKVTTTPHLLRVLNFGFNHFK